MQAFYAHRAEAALPSSMSYQYIAPRCTQHHLGRGKAERCAHEFVWRMVKIRKRVYWYLVEIRVSFSFLYGVLLAFWLKSRYSVLRLPWYQPLQYTFQKRFNGQTIMRSCKRHHLTAVRFDRCRAWWMLLFATENVSFPLDCLSVWECENPVHGLYLKHFNFSKMPHRHPTTWVQSNAPPCANSLRKCLRVNSGALQRVSGFCFGFGGVFFSSPDPYSPSTVRTTPLL